MADKKPFVSGATPGDIEQLQAGDTIAQADVNGLDAALAAKAPLASPALTGTPTAPTATAGTNNTQLATTAFVAAAVAAGGGGGGISWSVSGTATTLTADTGQIVTAAVNKTLPASLTAGQQFIVHAKVTGVRIVSNGNTITGVGAGNDLTLIAGETAHLVASAANTLEIV